MQILPSPRIPIIFFLFIICHVHTHTFHDKDDKQTYYLDETPYLEKAFWMTNVPERYWKNLEISILKLPLTYTIYGFI